MYSDTNISHFLLILLVLSGLKLSKLILPTIQLRSDLISLNIQDFISFILSGNWYYSLSYLFHHHNLPEDEQFLFILEASQEIHHLILTLIKNFNNLQVNSRIFPPLIDMIKSSQSMLPIVLCLKDRIFSTCLENYNVELVNQNIKNILQQEYTFSNHLEYTIESDISLQVALLVYQQHLHIIEDDTSFLNINEINHEKINQILLWKEITEYFHHLTTITNDFSDLEINKISNNFCFAFFLSNENKFIGSKTISNYLNIISCWELMEVKLKTIPLSHSRRFAESITHSLKNILFNITDPKLEVFETIEAKVFVDYLLKLRKIIKNNFFGLDNQITLLLESVGLSSIKFWEDLTMNINDLLNNNCKRFLFILEILEYLNFLWSNDQKEFVITLFPLISEPKLCFHVIYSLLTARHTVILDSKLNQELIISMIAKASDSCLNMISNLDNSKLDHLQFFVDILIYTNQFMKPSSSSSSSSSPLDDYQKNQVIKSFETIIKFNANKIHSSR